MKVNKTTPIMQHTTYAKMNGSFAGIHQLKPICQLFAFMGFRLPELTNLHVDNAAVATVIDSGCITPRCCHLDIPIALMQYEKDKDYIMKLVQTQLMLADMGTKLQKAPALRRFKYWGLGARFYPQPGHEHYVLLQMQFYESNFTIIAKAWRTSNIS
jgi:hypothetical protein